MSKTSQWIPVLLPKEVVEQLLKSHIASNKSTSYTEILKSLQSKTKEVKLFSGLSKQQVIKKLHLGKKKLLKENPHAYIDYTA